MFDVLAWIQWPSEWKGEKEGAIRKEETQRNRQESRKKKVNKVRRWRVNPVVHLKGYLFTSIIQLLVNIGWDRKVANNLISFGWDRWCYGKNALFTRTSGWSIHIDSFTCTLMRHWIMQGIQVCGIHRLIERCIRWTFISFIEQLFRFLCDIWEGRSIFPIISFTWNIQCIFICFKDTTFNWWIIWWLVFTFFLLGKK